MVWWKEFQSMIVMIVSLPKWEIIIWAFRESSTSYVGFELFVRPIIRKTLFCENPFLKFESVKFGEDFSRPNPFTRFVRSKLHIENGELLTSPVGIDKSNIVMSLAKTDSLTILPGGTRGF
jgi:molybdopterin molybdotransferase